MKKLTFDYYMQIDYSEVVSSCHFTIKCLPQETLRQRVEEINIQLSPNVPYNRGADSFGNAQIYGWDDVEHTTFSFRITGGIHAGLDRREEKVGEDMLAVFRHPHGMNLAGEAINAYHEKLAKRLPADPYEKALFLAHRLHEDFAYEKGCTDVNTTAEQAWKQGRGVCQDYAHILISLLHLEQIPARYVTGMIPGEGASHAWVEIAKDGYWYGIDPTNDVPVGDDHIKIGVGRDAADCMINRGIMHGGGEQRQRVKVSVNEGEA
ncbi:MAG: transglutaminase family protein [bacterium]|nr:transglutaminase family protein [bacterium]MCM1423630.1 transglutaminase family protein [bacterium]